MLMEASVKVGTFAKVSLTPEDYGKAKSIILSCPQHKTYPEVFACIEAQKEIPKQNPLRNLSPFKDDADCLRVGGRLSQADIQNEAHLFIIPGKHHVSTLLVRHYQQVQHQGRHFTEGAVRTAGL